MRHRSRNSSVAQLNATSSATTSSWSAHRNAALPSPPSRSSAPPGRPVRTSDSTARTPYGAALPSAIGTRPDRTAPPTSPVMTEGSSPSAAWIALAFVLSRYGGDAVENRSTLGVTSSGAARIASRAASTPIEVASSSYDATALVPFPPPAPSAAPIAARCRRQYGTYAPYATIPRATTTPFVRPTPLDRSVKSKVGQACGLVQRPARAEAHR